MKAHDDGSGISASAPIEVGHLQAHILTCVPSYDYPYLSKRGSGSFFDPPVRFKVLWRVFSTPDKPL